MKRNGKMFLRLSGMQLRERRLLCGLEEIDRKVVKEINHKIIKSKRERQSVSLTEIARDILYVCVSENGNKPARWRDGVNVQIKRYGDMTGETLQKSIQL